MRVGLLCSICAATLFSVVQFAQAEISGDYIDTRSADVYTGQCFANSEVGLTGDEVACENKVEFTIVDTLGREARGEILLSVERPVKTNSAAAGARTWPSVPANGSASSGGSLEDWEFFNWHTFDTRADLSVLLYTSVEWSPTLS